MKSRTPPFLTMLPGLIRSNAVFLYDSPSSPREMKLKRETARGESSPNKPTTILKGSEPATLTSQKTRAVTRGGFSTAVEAVEAEPRGLPAASTASSARA